MSRYSGPDPAGDAFDTLVAAMDAAVVVVTAAAGGERAGCLVGFHSQCSIVPRRYAVWLSRANHTYRVALAAEHVAVHPLGRGDADLARLFGAETGDEVDKFARCAWDEGPAGVPLLARGAGHLVLRRTAVLDVGADHSCLVGEPVLATPAGEPGAVLRFSDVRGLRPGHPAGGPPHPPPPLRPP